MQWIAFLLSNPPSQRLRGPLPTVRMTYTDSWVPPHTHDIRTSGRGLVILYVFQPPLWFSAEKKGKFLYIPPIPSPSHTNITYRWLLSIAATAALLQAWIHLQPQTGLGSTLVPVGVPLSVMGSGHQRVSLSFLWGAQHSHPPQEQAPL